MSIHHTAPSAAGILQQAGQVAPQHEEAIVVIKARLEDLQLQITTLAQIVSDAGLGGTTDDKRQVKEEDVKDSGAGGSINCGPEICESAFATKRIKKEVEETEAQSEYKKVSQVSEESKVQGKTTADCTVDHATTNIERSDVLHKSPAQVLATKEQDMKYKTPGSKFQDKTAECTLDHATTNTVLSEVLENHESSRSELSLAEVTLRIDRIMEGPLPDDKLKRELWRLMELARQLEAQPG